MFHDFIVEFIGIFHGVFFLVEIFLSLASATRHGLEAFFPLGGKAR